jgi:hypothetical protein
MGKRARGLTVIPSAYSGRREALTPQYRASQSPVRACPESPETKSQTTAYPRLHGGGGGAQARTRKKHYMVA